MKKLIIFWCFTFCVLPIFAGVADDGVIEDGEYDYGIVNLEDKNLLVTGGGAYLVHIKGSSYVEVQNTSPLSNSGGITVLVPDDNSQLKVYGGEIGTIDISDNAFAELYAGSINSIISYQYTSVKHITLYCQTGWEWQYTYDPIEQADLITGVTGLWQNGTEFDIAFVNDDTFGYDPVWKNINVIPEPATLVLLGVGSLLIRRKK